MLFIVANWIGIQMMQINFLKVYTVRFEAAD